MRAKPFHDAVWHYEMDVCLIDRWKLVLSYWFIKRYRHDGENS